MNRRRDGRSDSACLSQPAFVPMTVAEVSALGWTGIDVLLVSGDAYVDHPSFGPAILARRLIGRGFRVGIVAQPRWTSVDDISRIGRPGLFAGVTAGALDSMLAHYTAFRKKRSDDAYTAGGRAGARPNRAVVVYSNLVRQAFPGLPVVIGGMEASMRRASHYDFWSDSIRRSILLDSKADLLVYGMAERSLQEAADRLREAAGNQGAAGRSEFRGTLRGIRGTVFHPGADWACPGGEDVADLPSHDSIESDPRRLMDATLAVERQIHSGGPWLRQEAGGEAVVIAPPAGPLGQAELDALYALPFGRDEHPSYAEPVPAAEMIRFSVTSHRGCAGGCTFCSLAMHQGRRISSRSAASVVREVTAMTRHRLWKGSVSDVGGPTANMWGARCRNDPARCARSSCLVPGRCPHFSDDQSGLLSLLDRVAAVPGVKHVRVASGIRHDLAMSEPRYVESLVGAYVGGQLKLAPEHCSDGVLALMRKPSFRCMEEFLRRFRVMKRETGRDEYVIPYFMSAFPGCTDDDMRRLAAWLRARGWKPRQVQCFVPTPGTVATAMYHAGIAPDGTAIHVPKTDAERLRQHRILTGGWGRRP